MGALANKLQGQQGGGAGPSWLQMATPQMQQQPQGGGMPMNPLQMMLPPLPGVGGGGQQGKLK